MKTPPAHFAYTSREFRPMKLTGVVIIHLRVWLSIDELRISGFANHFVRYDRYRPGISIEHQMGDKPSALRIRSICFL